MQNDHHVDHLSKSAIKERGWTEALIRGFLGEADKTRQNPHYKSAPPMQMYLLTRIEQAEQRLDFLEAFERAQIRSRRGKAVAKQRTEELLNRVRNIEIPVQQLEPAAVLSKAIESYNHWNEGNLYSNKWASTDSDRDFLNRITVNYIRHHLTNYEAVVDALKGEVGRALAYHLVRNRVLDDISIAYPDLSDECTRQSGR